VCRLLIGGLLGFLFGIPRTLQQEASQATEQNRKDRPQETNYAVNTNLDQISDWLTKILVGVSQIACLATVAWLGIPAVSYSTELTNAITREKLVEEVILTIQDNWKTIDLPVGASLSVRLEEAPTTGYVWINRTVGDVLIFQDSDFSQSLQGIIGGSGLRTSRFVVGKPGNAILLLKRMREWEGESSVLEVFSVSIHAIPR
jgi:predicted secreted protein